MLTEREMELIQSDVDGELAVADRAELGRLLLAKPQARRLREDLQRLTQLLDMAPTAEPPATLQTAVLESIPWRSPTRSVSSWQAPLRIAAGFAVAALLVGTLYQLGRPFGESLDRAALSGTMARPSTSPSTSTAVAATRLDLQGLQGSVTVRGPVGSRQIDFEVATDRPVDVVATVGARENRYRLDASGTPARRSFPLDGPDASDVVLQFYSGGALMGSSRVVLSQ
jgi:hypothetical protein